MPGRNANDLPMFAAVGLSICMGGGAPEAKAAANYVTNEVLDDGICNALRHYGLL